MSTFCTLFSSSLRNPFDFIQQDLYLRGHSGLVVEETLYLLGRHSVLSTEVNVICDTAGQVLPSVVFKKVPHWPPQVHTLWLGVVFSPLYVNWKQSEEVVI